MKFQRAVFSILIGLLAFLVTACFHNRDPEKTVSEGFKKLADADNASFEMIFGGQDFLGEDNNLILRLSGKSFKSEKPEDSKADGNIMFSFGTPEGDFKFDIDIRILGKEIFMKLGDLTLPEESAFPKETIDVFRGKWWLLPSAEGNPLLQNLTDEQKVFTEQLKAVSLFKDPLKVSDEEIKGVSSEKYKVSFNPEGLEEIVVIVGKIAGNEVPEEEKEALRERLKTITFDGHVWVSKRGRIMNRIAGTIGVDLGEQEPESKPLSFSIDVTAWDFGKDFTVEKPADATLLDPSLFLGLTSLGISDAEEALEETDEPLGAEQAE